MEGWIDLVDLIAPRSGVEPAIFPSRVRRRTAAPPRQPKKEKSQTQWISSFSIHSTPVLDSVPFDRVYNDQFEWTCAASRYSVHSVAPVDLDNACDNPAIKAIAILANMAFDAIIY